MIIDSHLHLGTSMITTSNYKEADLLAALKKNGVDGAIVLPLPGASDEKAAHDEIAACVKKYPGKLWGAITLNPHVGDSYSTRRTEQQFFDEVERCVKKLKFVGIKLAPDTHCCAPNAPDADKVFRAAQEFDIPVISHTGLGIPNALPCLLIPPARKYPKVKIVMAHSGAYLFTPEAFVVAKECKNVWLETSWCAVHRIKQMIDEIGPERVMYGSDKMENIGPCLAQYREIGLSPAVLERVLSGTAREVYKLK